MSESAATKWEARRVETTRRLEWCALELTRDKGLDGWTMDDLAAAAGVSRRTVFNYFDGKADVVLGPDHELPDETVAVFVAGGPTGRLFDDLVHIAGEALQEKGTDLELVHLRRNVMRRDPRVIAIAHERFEARTEMAIDLILQREGEEYGATRARLLVQLLITIVDSVLDRSEPDLNRPLPDLITDAVRDARAVLID
ncbi:TetR/AcrR family transcriptional regulator [Nocardioides bizhenqiangii]|uniref:Helix-turn-helix domain-containing protein n=1 Tax=Nocardioides bizhenqiangii TaxID=3095076 RepID=A0ABZ0ZQV1_9ACTN|nr:MULTISPECIES: helix-turn-helix domain-containing protein [unclassified Nocardioides]MDZ5619294.1 helix-turn-helix domain-containing protein [Nocardioides sp. HM23]WQQ26683.1 helix-turn-helix domain-containing protein [Nocardioides sp. HM61]